MVHTTRPREQSSLELRSCTDCPDHLLARKIVDGQLPLQAAAIPVRLRCLKCNGFNPLCVCSWLTQPVLCEKSAGLALVAIMKQSPQDKKKIVRNAQLLCHRLAQCNEYSILSSLAEKYPITIGRHVANTDTWCGEHDVLEIDSLYNFAKAGVLGPKTLLRSLPSVMALRMTASISRKAFRLHRYKHMFDGKPHISAYKNMIVRRATGLPTEICQIIVAYL